MITNIFVTMTTFGSATLRLFVRMSLSGANQKRPFTVCVEGNIGSGKTTFLNNFKKYNNMMVLQEPVELWRNVSGSNLLDLMYKDPKRHGFIFQSYVQLTMLQLHTLKTELPYKVMERSVYSARCFIENMKRTKLLSDVEVIVLEDWYDWCISNAAIETDLIVYLRSSPDIVHRRIKQRARKEEDCVSLEYLRQVHDVHDEWLYKKTLFPVPAPVITLDADQNMAEMFEQFEDCKNRIFERQTSLDADKRISMGAATSPCKSKKIAAGSSD